jgi:hypothetical protein
MLHSNRDTIVKEGADLWVILQSCEITYDAVWVGGSTMRYRHDTAGALSEATAFDLEGQDAVIALLRKEVLDARRERRERKAGERIKRGQVHPRR